MSHEYNWIGAYITLCCDPHPRAFATFGMTTEIHTIRGPVTALFGWLP